MSKSVTIELADDVYESLRSIATTTGKSVQEIASEWLVRCAPKPRKALDATEAEDDWQRLRRCVGAVDRGDPRSADNDRIDADLAREYANNHENTPK